jgi:predicted permease
MNWLNRLLHGSAMEEQLEKELRFQLEEHAASLMARGSSPEEARRQARGALGGPEQVKERCRDARGTRWLGDLWQDLRYSLRILRNKPGFSAVALSTLALGIGAATVMFTVIDGVLLKPMPYGEPNRLVSVNGHTDAWNVALYGQQNLSYYDFLDLQRQSRSLELAGWFFNPGTMSDPGQAEYVVEFDASANLFATLGVSLFRGRPFRPEEDRPGGASVAILGYSLWQRRFAANLAVLGALVTLDGQLYTVVGIAPQGLRLRGDEGDIYTPLGQNTLPLLRDRRPHPIGAIARLRPGATLEQSLSELAAIGRQLAAQFPATNKDRGFIALPLRPDVGNVQSTLWLLLGAVGLVLLIACVNVASLLLARAVSRERELAMRAALGAGRGRLVRQCLTESAILGLAGGALGVALAAVGVRPFIAFWPGSLPRAEEIALDWRVLLFAVGASLMSGLLFGLAPALRVPARHLELALRAGGRAVTGSSRRMHAGFVVSEIALAMVLLVSAAMLGRTLLRLSAVDAGIDVHNVLTARMALSSATLADPAKIRAAWQDVLTRARRAPGVEAIAMVDTVPLRQGNNQIGYWTNPALPPVNQQPVTLASSVTPDYLKVMGIRLLEGRFFDGQDRMGNEAVAVIDSVMARAAFPGKNAVGKHLWIGLGNDPVRVVGVVSHVRYWGPAGDDQARVRSQLYYPFAQVPDSLLRRWSELMSIAVRTKVDPLGIVEPLRREVRGVGNDQVLYELNTMEQLVRDSLGRQRFLLLLFGLFAGLALLLACIGIYGVLAYLTGQRVPEIGVRMALGAGAGDVVWMILRQSLGMISVGVIAGIAGALAAGRLLQRLVEGMQPMDAPAFAITVLILVTAATAASLAPARRASRVNPIRALRQD